MNLRLLLGLIAVSAFGAAPANIISIRNWTAAPISNYPVQFARPFVQGEITNYPQVGLCTTSACVSITWLDTQADVKTRWTDTSVQHAIIAFLVPTLASGTTYFTFRNQAANPQGTALTKLQMQDAAYDFDATFELTNGATVTRSASELLNAWDGISSQIGPVYRWTSGQIAQTMIFADHRQTTTCNGVPCSAYDLGPGPNPAYKSFRPIWHVTFWPGISKAQIRFVGEIANSESMQDQVYSMALKIGAATPTTVYTHASFTHSAYSRWTIWHGSTNWTVSTGSGNVSIPKELWTNSGDPGPISIDHNRAYVVYTKVLPNFDPDVARDMTEAGRDAHWSAYLNSARGIALYDGGLLNDGQSSGEITSIGMASDPIAAWLFSLGDIRTTYVARDSDDRASHYPIALREGVAANSFLRTEAALQGTGLGRVLSTVDRADGAITLVGAKTTPTGPSGTTWTFDPLHVPEVGFASYVMTGQFLYLENLWFLANNLHLREFVYSQLHNCPSNKYFTGNIGDIRQDAWAQRAYMYAALSAPDGSTEKTYFTMAENDILARDEGNRNIVVTPFSNPANTSYAAYQCGVAALSNADADNQPNSWYGTPRPPGTLKFWAGGSSGFAQNEYGICGVTVSEPSENYCVGAAITCGRAFSQFEMHYMVGVLNFGKGAGFETSRLLDYATDFYYEAFQDAFSASPHYNLFRLDNGRLCTRDVSNNMLPDYTAVMNGYMTDWEPGGSSGDHTTYDLRNNYNYFFTDEVNHDPGSYAATAAALVAAVEERDNAVGAWSWYDTNHYSVAGTKAHYAIVPRVEGAAAPVAPTITSTSPVTAGTVGAAYSYSFTATGDTPITWTATGLPGWATLDLDGTLHGTLNVAATTSFDVTAANGVAPNDIGTFSITIGPASPASAPTHVDITSISGRIIG